MNKIYKFAIGIEYNGNKYHGWQKQQNNDQTIQQHIENAVSKIANHLVHIVCGGRTDVGVHSTGQVAHFETNTYRTHKSWFFGINSLLPEDIVLIWLIPIHKTFHARFSALFRRYHYIIYNCSHKLSIFNKLVMHYKYLLNINKMNQAAQFLIGEHDFTSFRSSQCQSRHSKRKIIHCYVLKHKQYIIIDIKANSFLQHMVRNIIGCLLYVGIGKQPITWISDLIKLKDRTKAAHTVQAHGLYLSHIIYPKYFYIPNPKNNIKMFFINY
ncbi:tRNA pseudouridine(38-40) synthase TruA [Enterobacteriaceae endosymbiont of Macroplea appendiculata]|uniref:tRNA pseudouridine(38-40) synthase TruA n=1 Tax=Enterobacteriaceae endosymbiont of Macroplea appendiculata TaxID=2675790 RepID=UPI001449722D|nr:tRNA pseudouridine(38-40) synthase TruA [Enterobacteriaceae endosymbiont of Macroplea appendiculata]QJC30692.1 tRNA pseudouridine(38-40) synthase TruA [Enterobacteriaceae endosymbiont of Macroplea appendiculata]